MSTFADLKTAVSRDIRDPDGSTFSAADVGDMINAALAEVGRIAPYQFTQDITPIADTLAYQLQTGTFGTPTPEIQVKRVEIWDTAYAPYRLMYTLLPASAAYVNSSAAGWEVWGGILYVNNEVESFLEPSRHILRVQGYRPYPALVADGTPNPASPELEAAMRVYCRVEALQRLMFERDLFTEWQTSSNNTNVTPASLMNSLSLAQADWERRSKKLAVLRVAS